MKHITFHSVIAVSIFQ